MASKKLQTLQAEVKQIFMEKKSMVKRPARGKIPYDYLVPAGYYQEQWDWDAFFMGVALSSEIASEAIYLKNWARNYIHFAAKDGKVPGCVTPDGADPRLNHMKPFLGQGIYVACTRLEDWEWVKPIWSKVKLVVSYREKNLWSKKYGLAMWYDSMESGADDDVGSLFNEPKTVCSPDVNALMYREYKALSKIAVKIGEKKDAEEWKKRAELIKENMNKYLWDDTDKIYYNLDTKTGQHNKRITYSTMIPLFAGIASQKNGEECIKKYLWNTKHMLSKYGIRTLSKHDEKYNNVNRIKPHSNWQGPVWPIANWLYMQALLNYGFQKEAIDLSGRIMQLVLNDIHTSGGMHENYDAETGKPLAADNFVSWNLLVGNMLDEAEKNFNPLRI
jgi:alpha,alpha-trehalase